MSPLRTGCNNSSQSKVQILALKLNLVSEAEGRSRIDLQYGQPWLASVENPGRCSPVQSRTVPTAKEASELAHVFMGAERNAAPPHA